MVFVALIETMIVHLLLKTQRDRLAISIDKVMRITIPLFLYPLVTFTTMFWGMEQNLRCPGSALCGEGRPPKTVL